MTPPTPQVYPASDESALTIPVCEPFEWAHSLRFIRDFPATRNEQVIEGRKLIKAWRLREQTMVTRIGSTGDRPELEAQLASTSEITPKDRAAIADRILFYLSAGDDLTHFNQTARADPRFAPVAAQLHGYHQVKFPTPFESIVWSILAQRIPVAVARDVKLRLMDHLSVPVKAFGGTFTPFPSLEQVTELSLPELTELIHNPRKVRYVHETALKLTNIDESFLRHGDYQDVRESLLSLPGIGPWSANFVMIRGLGRMEMLPEDTALLRAARQVYGAAITMADLERLSAPYGPDQGYWAHYLRISH